MSRFDKYREIKLVQLLNIYSILLLIVEPKNLFKFNVLKDVQLLNI